ncbi:MAG: TonB-dependent receptor [Pseudomonadota bacterium]
MITQKQIRLTKLALALSIALSAAPTFAQNTTSAIGGRVAGADGRPVAGAQVSILHTESNSVSNVSTDAEGRYVARGLRVGGPYTIIITKDGITEKRENVFVQLAETASIDATLGQAMQTVTVTGTANRSERFNRTTMGAGTSIGATELATQGSIQRNLQDYARADPRVSQNDKERGEISVAGQNSRYNTITVDGVAINDTFGLESNGSPTARQAISIEAIQSVQVNVANYDVTQKGYTGANINAVTKSGTNTWKGGAYYVWRNDRFVGERYNNVTDTYSDAPKFKETTKGLWASGALIEDKLFIYALTEKSESSRASPDFGIIGSTAGTTVPITAGAVAAAQQIARDVYGIEIGGLNVPAGSQLSSEEKLLKVDWNISDNHRANFRYGKTTQSEPVFPSFSATGVTLDSMFYSNEKSIETAVAQVFSDWTPTFSTEFRASLRDYDSVPKNSSRLPSIGLAFSGALPAGVPAGTSTSTRYLNFGTEYARQLNVLGTKTMDYYGAANWIVGDHEIKGGFDYSTNKIYNAYLQNVFGSYTFGCDDTLNANICRNGTAAQIEAAVLQNFRNGNPTSYTVQVAAPGASLADGISSFTMKNTGLFLQDTWTASKNLTVTYGVRVDETGVGSKPLANADVARPVIAGNYATGRGQTGGFGYDNTVTPDGKKLWQPRVGFNYKFDTARPTQIRGGAGLFQGAAASVWMSNPFSNPGIATRTITCATNATRCPATNFFSPDPDNQPADIAGSTPLSNVDILDPGLRQPSIWKANLAFDTELPWYGMVFGAEFLYTNNKDSIYYEHLNLGASTATAGTDGRQLFWNPAAMTTTCYAANAAGTSLNTTSGCTQAKYLRNRSYNNVLVAKNTSEGDGKLITVSLSKPLTKGFGWSLAYTHTNATEVSPLSSSVANSNWQARSVFNPNEEVASNSNTMAKHRLNALANFQKKFFGSYNTRLGVFYEARSGKPYSWTYKNDLNGDGIAGNDLMYIPKAFGSGEVVFLGDTATSHTNEERFWSIVNGNKALRDAAGGVVGRNKSFSDWTNVVDMRVSQEIPGFFARNKAVFTLDFFNVGNLLNKKWGHTQEPSFSSSGGTTRGFVDYAGMDAQGRYVYFVRNKADDLTVKQSKNESQWAIQATVKYEF